MELVSSMKAKLPPDRKFINTLWGHLSKPSYQKSRPHLARNCEITRKTFYQLFMNHIINMKEKFPETDGRLCRYCEAPLTFIYANVRSPKEIREKNGYLEKKRTPIMTNVSVDCLHPSIGYTYENIIFSCGGCNRRKNDITPADILNIMRVYQEVETDDPFKGTSIEGKD
tara:strand:+ start:48 stop:557 length:510 start_codon:yes stop_codon:yes gene_type:complete